MIVTLLLSALLILVDQLIKMLAVRYLAPVGSIPFIPGVLEWRYLENDGAAFSILQGQQGLLITITGTALLLGLWYLLFRRPKDRLEYISIVMIFSGGVGNLIDRIANGYVVDYIHPLFINFATFNFADMLVVVGFGLLVIAVVRSELRAKKKAEADEAAGVAEAGGETTQDTGDTADTAAKTTRADGED